MRSLLLEELQAATRVIRGKVNGRVARVVVSLGMKVGTAPNVTVDPYRLISRWMSINTKTTGIPSRPSAGINIQLSPSHHISNRDEAFPKTQRKEGREKGREKGRACWNVSNSANPESDSLDTTSAKSECRATVDRPRGLGKFKGYKLSSSQSPGTHEAHGVASIKHVCRGGKKYG
jgi:hypothetical protein